MKTHTFRGKTYHIATERLDGLADQDEDKQRWLFIFRDLRQKVGLETAIHEALHACDWKASEEDVTGTACDIARFLWRLGYRMTNDS
jgi:hypothetical protein